MAKTKLTLMSDAPAVQPTEHEGPTKKDKFLSKFALGALLLTAVVIVLMFFWATDNSKVLDIKNAPFPTRTIREHPTAGGVVILDVDYCKNRNIEGDLRMSFVSASREIFLPMTKEKGPKGCTKTEFPVLIPKEIPADTYKIKFRVDYDLNPLKQNVREEFETQPIVIDESAENPDRLTQPSQ